MIVFSKEWFERYQKPLLFFSNTRVGRRILYINGDKSNVGKNKITRIGPQFLEWSKDNQKVVEFRSHAKFSKRLYYSFKPFWHLLHFWDIKIANSLIPMLNAGFDTLTAYAEAYPPSTTAEGQVMRLHNVGSGETFSVIRAGSGTDVAQDTRNTYTIALTSDTLSNKYQALSRYIVLFDTSSIGSLSTINSVGLFLYGSFKQNGLGSTDIYICSSSPSSNTTLAASDYSQLGTTLFASKTYSSFSTSAYNNFSLNASGISEISTTGITKLGARVAWDFNNSFTGTWSSQQQLGYVIKSANNSGTSLDPYLVVTYTPATAPTVTSSAVSNNTSLFSATGNGNVTSDGGDTITERGIVINTTGTPTTSDTKFSTSGTTGAYSVSMTSLIPGTLYYVRAYAINSTGTSYGSEVTFTAVNFLNPTNAYAEDGSFCTAGGDSGAINVQLSGDGGSTWSNTLSKTFNGTNGFLTFGAGSTELWGQAWLGSQVTDTNFRVRVSTGTRTSYTHIWKTFGFAPGSSVILTGIELKIKAKWITDTTSIDVIDVKIYYGSSVLPVVAGSQAYATDAGGGTGALEVYNGSAWKELADTSRKLSAFASTSSSELAGVISDETGSGALVFGTSPTISSPTIRAWDGWQDANITWTYASGAGTNVGTFTITGDYTAVYKESMPVKFTQTTVKYGWIVKDSTVSSGTTTVTVYLGTDYTIANASISANYYGLPKQPGIGFPTDADKWTITLTYSSDGTQTSPVNGTWYNIDSQSITLLTGSWDVWGKVPLRVARSSSTVNANVTLSTANNSESDTDLGMSYYFGIGGSTSAEDRVLVTIPKKKITVTSSTPYYVNVMSSQSASAISIYGSTVKPMVIKARIAYL